jgi:hypothetical protein
VKPVEVIELSESVPGTVNAGTVNVLDPTPVRPLFAVNDNVAFETEDVEVVLNPLNVAVLPVTVPVNVDALPKVQPLVPLAAVTVVPEGIFVVTLLY